MPTPRPHQIEGALFLSSRGVGMLADEQRVGKTGASIVACDFSFARTVLVVTKASARANWGREFREWGFPRTTQVVYKTADAVLPNSEVVVVGWGSVFSKALYDALMQRRWDVVILDEAHEAKSPTAKRTLAVYGEVDGHGLVDQAAATWLLTGTPIPNAPIDLFPALRKLSPERLAADPARGFPDVSTYTKFLKRYCVTRKKYVGGQWIEYAIKGQNETELRERLRGFWLRRTQQDVGITRPIFSVMLLHVDKLPRDLIDLETDAKLNDVLVALETGVESEEPMHLGSLRRLTGMLKAVAVVEAVKEALDDGLDKVVLMAWHTDVIDALKSGLSAYGVVGIDGRTPPTKRDAEAQAFQKDETKRVFVGQILAAGEAIDLSRSAELWFVESSFVPKDMAQAAMRVTNMTQNRQALVRFCALEGSIDEALQAILARKVASIKTIMEN